MASMEFIGILEKHTEAIPGRKHVSIAVVAIPSAR